jgi:hypothetical protein
MNNNQKFQHCFLSHFVLTINSISPTVTTFWRVLMSPKKGRHNDGSQGDGDESSPEPEIQHKQKQPALIECSFVALNTSGATMFPKEDTTQFEQLLDEAFKEFPKCSVYFGSEYPKSHQGSLRVCAMKLRQHQWKIMDNAPKALDPVLFYDSEVWREKINPSGNLSPPNSDAHENCRPRMVLLESVKCSEVKFLAVPVHGEKQPPKKLKKLNFKNLLLKLIDYTASTKVTVVMGGDFNLKASAFKEIIEPSSAEEPLDTKGTKVS